MKILDISYNMPLSEIDDIENDNIDVFVEIDDGTAYTFTAITPKNFYWYMDKEELDFFPIGTPYIIVRQLTDEIIRSAIQKALDDEIWQNAYWLKLYHLAGNFDIKMMDQMIEKIKIANKEIFDE